MINYFKLSVFLSNAWRDSAYYEPLLSWLFYESWSVGSHYPLIFHNYSLPPNSVVSKIVKSSELLKILYENIHSSHVVLLPSAEYEKHEKLVETEIDAAKKHNKTILAINLSKKSKTNGIVKKHAHKSVNWDKHEIVKGIWHLYLDSI